MPKGIYERTPEMRTGKYVKTKGHLEKMRKWSPFQKGHKYLPSWGFQKGHPIYLKYHTEETKQKISLASKGKPKSVEHRKKLSKSLKGKRTGIIPKNVFPKGHIPWSKGKKLNYIPNWKHGMSQTKNYKKLESIKRRTLVKNGGKITFQTIQMVYEDNIKRYGTLTCYLCENPISFGKDHLEHKIPLSRGGDNKYNNLAIACQKCNLKKFTKTEEEYRKELCNNG